MICDNCKSERLVTDFINNQKFCYHCVYREKVEKSPENQTEKKRLCRTCNNEIIRKKNEKKRQRSIFCSRECASLGHKNQLSNHWTRKVKGNMDFKGECTKDFIPITKRRKGFCSEYAIDQTLLEG
jgi:hypothetical protein